MEAEQKAVPTHVSMMYDPELPDGLLSDGETTASDQEEDDSFCLLDESGDLAELANTDEAASESESEDEEVFFGPTTMKEKLVVQTAALLEHDNGNGNTTAQQNKDSSVPPEPIKNSDDVINDEKDENDDDDDEIFFGGVSVKECTRRLHNMPAVLEHQQQVQHHKQQQRIRQHKRDMIRQHTQLPRPSRLVQPRARGSYATGASEEYIPIAKDPSSRMELRTKVLERLARSQAEQDDCRSVLSTSVTCPAAVEPSTVASPVLLASRNKAPAVPFVLASPTREDLENMAKRDIVRPELIQALTTNEVKHDAVHAPKHEAAHAPKHDSKHDAKRDNEDCEKKQQHVSECDTSAHVDTENTDPHVDTPTKQPAPTPQPQQDTERVIDDNQGGMSGTCGSPAPDAQKADTSSPRTNSKSNTPKQSTDACMHASKAIDHVGSPHTPRAQHKPSTQHAASPLIDLGSFPSPCVMQAPAMKVQHSPLISGIPKRSTWSPVHKPRTFDEVQRLYYDKPSSS